MPVPTAAGCHLHRAVWHFSGAKARCGSALIDGGINQGGVGARFWVGAAAWQEGSPLAAGYERCALPWVMVMCAVMCEKQPGCPGLRWASPPPRKCDGRK